MLLLSRPCDEAGPGHCFCTPSLLSLLLSLIHNPSSSLLFSSLHAMRIRGRNLPYPVLVSEPSSSSAHRFLVLPPIGSSSTNTRGAESSNAFVKIEEKGLHPNGDLGVLGPRGSGKSSVKRDSLVIGSCSSNQVQEWKLEEEEEKAVHESTSNGSAQANIVNNRNPNNSSSQDQQKDSKKPKRGSTELLEGSRCSRINGRGWRCSQPTLIGYSLCEHHLGKGRQKSLAGTSTSAMMRPGQLGCTDQLIRKNLSSYKGLGEESLRKKKARSINSLLDD